MSSLTKNQRKCIEFMGVNFRGLKIKINVFGCYFLYTQLNSKFYAISFFLNRMYRMSFDISRRPFFSEFNQLNKRRLLNVLGKSHHKYFSFAERKMYVNPKSLLCATYLYRNRDINKNRFGHDR